MIWTVIATVSGIIPMIISIIEFLKKHEEETREPQICPKWFYYHKYDKNNYIYFTISNLSSKPINITEITHRDLEGNMFVASNIPRLDWKEDNRMYNPNTVPLFIPEYSTKNFIVGFENNKNLSLNKFCKTKENSKPKFLFDVMINGKNFAYKSNSFYQLLDESDFISELKSLK
ncbi:hypothetical protein SAMN04487792_1672 [Lactobacillus bombicola]|uniref:Uncharacterized protein n=1 Tax=Lactobacillus bombicola TaxID=1505723 RepID=A0A1I1TXA2_9LACO|nr:hypothetical protein [Lactobacillus bombicola]SFD63241.1 hypothetical protein SAMN04487792_1672 [Lactobacillus bombicola]